MYHIPALMSSGLGKLLRIFLFCIRGQQKIIRRITVSCIHTGAADAEEGGGVAFDFSAVGALGQRVDLFYGKHGQITYLMAASADKMIMIRSIAVKMIGAVAEI